MAVRALILAAALVLLTGESCSRRKRLPPVGEAFVAPISLNVRQDLAPRSAIVAALKHGERVDILVRRRRFVKVRTAAEAEGWVDSRQLMSTQGMQRLRRFHAWAKRLPSQGKVTPLDLLNVHIDPNRHAPSFSQISPEGTGEVLIRMVTRRGAYVPDAAPSPPPPGPHDIKDDWTLVRLSDGRSGWALSRMMTMNLPESVGMFAQGHRITSYHQLGAVKDRSRGQVSNYIWTTSSSPPDGFNFDRFRVTVWNSRNRRFETAHIESNIRGFYPVTVHTRPEEPVQRFTLNYAEGKGPVLERTFEISGRTLTQVAKKPWTPPPMEPDESDTMIGEEEDQQEKGMWDKVREKVKGWTGR